MAKIGKNTLPPPGYTLARVTFLYFWVKIWAKNLVQELGSRTWFKNLVQELGSRTWANTLDQEHELRTQVSNLCQNPGQKPDPRARTKTRAKEEDWGQEHIFGMGQTNVINDWRLPPGLLTGRNPNCHEYWIPTDTWNSGGDSVQLGSRPWRIWQKIVLYIFLSCSENCA